MNRLLVIITTCVFYVTAASQDKHISRQVEFKFAKAEHLNFTKETRSYIFLQTKNLYISSDVLESKNVSISLGKLEVKNHESGATIKKYAGTDKNGRKLIVWATYVDEKLIKVALQEEATLIIFGYMEIWRNN